MLLHLHQPMVIAAPVPNKFFVLFWTGEKFDWAECASYELAVALIESDMDVRKVACDGV